MAKKNDHRRLYLHAAMVMYVLVLCFHLIFSRDFFESISLTQVINEIPHILVPSKATFYLWPVILAWEAVGVFVGSVREKYEKFNSSYQLLAAPKLVELYLYHVIYLVFWSQKLYLFAFIIVVLYLRRMISFMKLISRHRSLNQPSWLLKYPIGLHTGWLIAMLGYAFYTHLKSFGLEGHNIWFTVMACVVIIVMVGLSAYLYAKYGNQLIMPAVLIFLMGLIVHHFPDSPFSMRHDAFFLIVTIAFFIALFIYSRYLRYQLKQEEK